MTVTWDVKSYGVMDRCEHFRETSYLHLHSGGVSHAGGKVCCLNSRIVIGDKE
jgi:hypothetical protein